MLELSMFEALFGEETRIRNEIKDQGYSITEAPLWIFDKNALKIQPEPIFRLDLEGKRYYYKFLDRLKTEPIFYVSVGSSIASLDLLPTGKGILEYYAKHDRIEDVYRDIQRAADYGIFFHILAAQYCRDSYLILDSVPELASQFKARNQLDYDNRHWSNRAKRDLIALDTWLKEHEVKPIAVELMLACEEGFASAIDLVCEMTIGTSPNGKIYKKDIKNAECERVNAIVDFKTGKGFWENNYYQLEAGRRLIKYNFPTLRIDKLYNVSPKGMTDLRCEMEDQTGKALEKVVIGDFTTTLFDAYWGIYKTKFPDYNRPRYLTEITGMVNFDSIEYKLGGKDPRDIVVQKHRKDY